MKKNFGIELLRIAIAAPIGFWAVDKVQLSTALNILMFFVIYMAVALSIEGIRRLVRRRKN